MTKNALKIHPFTVILLGLLTSSLASSTDGLYKPAGSYGHVVNNSSWDKVAVVIEPSHQNDPNKGMPINQILPVDMRFTLAARGLPPMDDNNGAPDSYAQITGAIGFATTKTLTDEHNPDWPDEFTVSYFAGQNQYIDIEVRDSDPEFLDQSIGWVHIPLDAITECQTKIYGILNGAKGNILITTTAPCTTFKATFKFSVFPTAPPPTTHEPLPTTNQWIPTTTGGWTPSIPVTDDSGGTVGTDSTTPMDGNNGGHGKQLHWKSFLFISVITFGLVI